VPVEVKKDRRNRLNELLKKISAENNEREIWMIRKVMITKKSTLSEDSVEYTWYTDNMKQIKITHHNDNSSLIWQFVQVKIIDSKQFILFGEVI
jgi:tRNA A37 methylthiotransferase MiaB